jgi:hypothetical protein
MPRLPQENLSIEKARVTRLGLPHEPETELLADAAEP